MLVAVSHQVDRLVLEICCPLLEQYLEDSSVKRAAIAAIRCLGYLLYQPMIVSFVSQVTAMFQAVSLCQRIVSEGSDKQLSTWAIWFFGATRLPHKSLLEDERMVDACCRAVESALTNQFNSVGMQQEALVALK